jgi:hypothetical protein
MGFITEAVPEEVLDYAEIFVVVGATVVMKISHSANVHTVGSSIYSSTKSIRFFSMQMT